MRLWFFAGLLPLAASAASSWEPLFNGKDLSGWRTWLAVPAPTVHVPGLAKDAAGKYTAPVGADRDPLGVFTVVSVDGRPALRMSGEVFGTATTVKSFSNYHLRLQFKWGARKWAPRLQAPRDSGVLYHGHGPFGAIGAMSAWQRSLEFQLQEKDCGDLYPLGVRVWVRARSRDEEKLPPVFDPTQPPRMFDLKTHEPKDPRPNYVVYGRCDKQADHEKAAGEWNTIDLVVLGADSIHAVNGHVVMRLSRAEQASADPAGWTSLTSGQISLQSEGAEVFYRDIELRPITGVPAEFAER